MLGTNSDFCPKSVAEAIRKAELSSCGTRCIHLREECGGGSWVFRNDRVGMSGTIAVWVSFKSESTILIDKIKSLYSVAQSISVLQYSQEYRGFAHPS